MNGLEEDDHLCPATGPKGKVVDLGPPMYGEIVWVCERCLKVHVWDLIEGDAAEVLREKQAPGFAIRPDITILDQSEKPTAFIEFHASHLSDDVKDIACEAEIPLFVVDVERVPGAFKPGLQNPSRGMFRALADVSGLPYTEQQSMADEASYKFAEGVGEEGGISAAFAPIPDLDGNLADVHFHAVGSSPALPSPSTGQYLIASWSSLNCDSQRCWLEVSGV